ncbi:MAG: TRAP transporter substrate-binding protein DctP [Caldilineaceae bacterium]|nr:TRAP transporter substrate-binding protein DctP [Caldilineaceae bacterium]
MDRREFLQTLATRTVAASALGFAAGCASQELGVETPSPQAIAQDSSLPAIDWQMATSWPVALDTIFGSVQVFVDRVSQLSGGKFKIAPRAAGELAPGTQVLDVVSQGAVPIGHTASYYYIGKSTAIAFGTTVPFGLTAQQQSAWLREGGGLALLQGIYAERFNVIQFPAGNTGAQMGGWFRKEINTVADLQGLKMRIPGLGGQVMAKLGVTVQALPGNEIFPALQTGTVDAAEWVGPYDDEKLGLNTAADYYYAPGWWEPGSELELEINLDEWNKLPAEYQNIIQVAAYEAGTRLLASYEARNGAALQRMVDGGAQVRTYSEEILVAAQEATFALYDEFAAADADFKTIYDQWLPFRNQLYAWNKFNEHVFTSFAYSQIGQ